MPDSTPDKPAHVLRLGTRGSLLARTQSRLVADALQARHPGLRVDLHVLKTTGDQIADRPLHEFGGKGLFTKELEQALLAGEVDFAVHSFKDVPVTMPLVDATGLIIAAVPERESPFDVLVSLKARVLADLPPGAKVGTGSLRRRCQVLATQADVMVEGVRGNIDTRLRKLREGQYDAILLAAAGLRRAGLFDPAIMTVLDQSAGMTPAAGQGALALQCRRDDGRTRELLVPLDDPQTATCVAAEREVVRLLQGDCHSPIAAWAQVEANETLAGPGWLTLHAAVGARDGNPPVVRASADGPADGFSDVVAAVFQALTRQGVQKLLAGT